MLDHFFDSYYRLRPVNATFLEPSVPMLILLALFPGLFIFITVTSVNALGEAVRGRAV